MKTGTMKTQADYMKLQEDIRAALEAGAAEESRHTDDFGSCNFDSPILVLHAEDGWDAYRAESAANAAGARCYLQKPARRGRDAELNLEPRTRFQREARSANAEAISKALRAAGYDSHVRYVVD